MHARPPVSLMMYSDDILGLGHLRRNTSIACQVLKERPGSSILMLTGLPSGSFFEVPSGIDFIKLPSIMKVDTGVYRARSLNVSEQKVRALRTAIIEQAVQSFMPDLFLVDHMPLGIWGELRPTFDRLKSMWRVPKLVLGLRDILDAPDVTRAIWTRDGVYDAIREYYDQVLIYGSPNVFETDQHYLSSEDIVAKSVYCGYLCTREAYGEQAQMRRELGVVKDKLILVTAGGGADAYPMMEACMEAVALLAGEASVEAIFLTGPYMQREQRDALTRRAAGLPLRICRSADRTLDYLSAADLVVTMAGYNTLMEAIQLGKQIVAIPRKGPSAEQTMRATLFAEKGYLHTIALDRATPAALGELFARRLREPPPGAPLLAMEGVGNAVAQISALCDEAWPEPGLVKVNGTAHARALPVAEGD